MKTFHYFIMYNFKSVHLNVKTKYTILNYLIMSGLHNLDLNFILSDDMNE